MKMKCHGCGSEHDTDIKEMYEGDRLANDVPIEPLFVLCALNYSEDGNKGRKAVVCHKCFDKLNVDMWISDGCWRGINPVTPYESLPVHTDENCDEYNPLFYLESSL